MHGEKRERWMQLCQQAAEEQDSKKLMVLVREISRLLEEKEQRLTGEAQNPQPGRLGNPNADQSA